MSDWSWLLSSPNRREYLLRDQVDTLSAALSRQSIRAGRVSSRLARVQGSLEQRLDALSRAFDAYVELGDVRVDLLQFTGTEAVRRAAGEAMSALADGRDVPEVPVDPAYWLSAAVRALVARCAGTPHEALEREAYALEPRAELFAVAALGALGHGGDVADRVASLLVTDAGLDTDQLALWRAVCAGYYGPGTVTAVLTAWPLEQGAPAERHWVTWLRSRATRDHELVWLTDQATATPVPAVPPPAPQRRVPRPLPAGPAPADPGPAEFQQPPFLREPEPSTATASQPPAASPLDELRGVVTRLVAEGRPDEQELLVRARRLREVIEHPERRQADAAAPPPTPVARAVQEAFAAAEPAGTPLRLAVLSWARPALLAAAGRIAREARPGPVQVRASTPGGVVAVTAAGADSSQVQAAKQAAAASSASAVPRNVALVGAAVGLAAGVVVAVSGGHIAFVILLFLLAVVLGGYGAKRWWDLHSELVQRARDVAAVDHAVSAALERAEQRQASDDDLCARLDGEEQRVRAALEALPALSPGA